MRLLSKRLDNLEAQLAYSAGYWVSLESDCKKGQTSDSVIANYESANGVDPSRNYIVLNFVYPKDRLS